MIHRLSAMAMLKAFSRMANDDPNYSWVESLTYPFGWGKRYPFIDCKNYDLG